MKSKTPLVLIEQIIMILVFAVSAAICLKVFVYSENMSKNMEMKDRAFVYALNTAEVIKNNRGDLNKTAEILNCRKESDDKITYMEDDEYKFVITAEIIKTENEYLGCAEINVTEGDEIYAQMEICWQEE